MDSMSTINVLVVNKFDDESLQKIAAVSPRIRVITSSPMWEAPAPNSGERIDCNDAEFNNMLAQTEVLLGFRPPLNVLTRAPGLKWIQTVIT